MIKAADLIEKFRYALENDWGYIWGRWGQIWTAADQANASKEMTVKYGAKWIGHHVADCSGLFRWAYDQLGLAIAHGSNSIYDRYCKDKGKLKSGKRTDGRDLLPGTAVFTGDVNDRGHIGLYIGGGDVIEAKGTQAGVVKSKVTESRWTWWGELTAVDYSKAPEPQPKPGTAIVTGKRVALRKDPSKSSAIIMRIDTGETVTLEPDPPNEWDYVSYKGKTGWMMREFLNEG